MLKRLLVTLPILALLVAAVVLMPLMGSSDTVPFPPEEAERLYLPETFDVYPRDVWAQQVAPTGSLAGKYYPSKIGAGIVTTCGGDRPGIVGPYICSLTITGNTVSGTLQVADNTQQSGVRSENFSFSLAGGQADGVVTAGAFSSDNMTLNLTVTAGGITSTVAVNVPDAIRSGASFSLANPADVVVTGASPGTSTDAARSDHVHAGDRDTNTQRVLGTGNPALVGATGQNAGTGTVVARENHVHQLAGSQTLPTSATQGQVAIWDNSNSVWVAGDALTSQNLPVYVANGAATQSAQTFSFVATPTLGTSPRLGATVVWKTPSTIATVATDPTINLLITGGPASAEVTLADGTGVKVSDLSANAPYIVVWDNTRWRIPDAVQTGTGGGASSFTGLSDTPSTLSGSSRYILRVNAGATAIEFVEEAPPSHAIENYGRLPAATADTPDLIYITHDYTEGTRSDATVTVGADGGFVGYSDSSDIPAFGSVSESSPMNALYGDGTTSDYAITTLESDNQRWIDSLSAIYIDGTAHVLTSSYLDSGFFVRSVTSPPENLSAASFSLNFELDSGVFQFTDAATDTVQGGLYEKVLTGAGNYVYVHISLGEHHIDGTLPPIEPPEFAGQLYVSDEGKLWVAGDQVIEAEGNSITSGSFVNSYWVTPPAEDCNQMSDGQFIIFGDGFAQRRNTICLAYSWDQMWTYITSIDDTAANRALRDSSAFLGFYSFDAQQMAADARAQQTDDIITYYYADTEPEPDAIFEITGFTEGTNTDTDFFHWRGFQLVTQDALDIIEDEIRLNASTADPSQALQTFLIKEGVTVYQVGYVRPDRNTGILRDPSASDYELGAVGFDGQQLVQATRTLVQGHTASATFTETAENANITINGQTFRWRGSHHHDSQVGSPVALDFYYNLSSNRIRLYTSVGWADASVTGNFAAGLNLIGFFNSQSDALAHVTADGQRVIYPNSSGMHNIWTVSAFVAAEATHFQYVWAPMGAAPLSANPDTDTTHNLITATIGGTTFDIGGLILADNAGELRAARADDWDTGDSKSKVIAWDGRDFLRADRQITTGHGSSATFTEVSEGTTIGSYVWRGVHNADNQAGASPASGWVYYHIFQEVLRHYDGSSWAPIPAGSPIPDALNLVGYPDPGVYFGESAALHHVSANGQRVMIQEGGQVTGRIALYTISAYVAPAAANTTYSWVKALDLDFVQEVIGASPSDPIHASFDQLYASRDNSGHNTGGLEYKRYQPETWLIMEAGGYRYSTNTLAAIGATVGADIDSSNRTFGSTRPTLCSTTACFYIWEYADSGGYDLYLHFPDDDEHDLEDYAQLRIMFREAGTTGSHTTVVLPRFSVRTYRIQNQGGTLSTSTLQTRRSTLKGNWFDAGTTYEVIFEHRATNSDPWEAVEINPAAGYLDDILTGNDRNRIETMAHRNIGDLAESGNIWVTLDLRAPLDSYADADIMRLEIENSLLNQTCEWPMSVVQKMTDRTSSTQTTGYTDNQLLGCVISPAHTSAVREFDEFSALVVGKNNDGQLAITAGEEALDNNAQWLDVTSSFLQEATVNLRAVYYGGGLGGTTTTSTGGSADAITVATANFDGNLSSTDDTVQDALETLDDLSAGGLTQAQVDARVAQGVYDWAEQANTDFLPLLKLAVNQRLPTASNEGQVPTWSTVTNSWIATFPFSVIDPVESAQITYTNQYTLAIANETDITVGDVILFQFNPGSALASSTNRFSVGLTGHSNDDNPNTEPDWTPNGDNTYVKIQDAGSTTLRDMTLNDLVRYNIYMLYRAGSFWHFVGGTRVTPGEAITQDTVYDEVKAIVQAGTNVTVTADDTANTLTVASTGGGGSGRDVDYARVTFSASYDLSSQTYTVPNWATESFDDDNFFVSTAASRLTIPTGKTRAKLTCNFFLDAMSGSPGLILAFRKNGSEYVAVSSSSNFNENSAGPTGVHADTGVIAVAAGDYFEMYIYTHHTSTVSFNQNSFFSIEAW